MTRLTPVAVAVAAVLGTAATLAAQTPVEPRAAGTSDAPQPVTRAQAVAIALARGVSAAVGRADTAAARAQLVTARALPNPTLTASATKSAPQLHATLDVPLDLPYYRNLRVGSARASLEATRLQFAYTRATVRYDVEVAYGQALAAAERARLSRESARDADSLLVLARAQRDAGDASDLDANLAAINAGQQANVAAADSLAALAGVLDLQALLGLPSDRPTITLAESLPALIASAAEAERALGAPAAAGAPNAPGAGAPRGDVGLTTGQPSVAAATPLPVAAAAATYVSQDLALGLARRRNALVPSFQVGVEGRDPTGGPQGVLPVVGVSIPLPLFNRLQGDIALAAANRERAQALLDAARRTAEGAIARARRELVSSEVRLARDAALLTTARDVAAKTLTGYREGASALPAVLQAQRAVRDAFAQYVTDAVAAANAAAAVRLATATSATP